MVKVDMENHEHVASFQHPKMFVDVLLLQDDIVRSENKYIGYGWDLEKNGRNDTKGSEISNGSLVITNSSLDELVRKDVAVLLPMDEFHEKNNGSNEELVRFSFSVLSDASLIVPNLTRISDGSAETTDYLVDGPVVVVKGRNQNKILSETVQIIFRSSNSISGRVCVYWDKTAHGNQGGWSAFTKETAKDSVFQIQIFIEYLSGT